MKYPVLIALMAIPTVAAAPNAVSLTSNVVAEKTVVVNGQQQIVTKDTKHVLPGDRLLFTTSYRNTTAQPVQRFVVTNPIPAGVTFNGESTPGAQVSIDGGRSYGTLSALRVGSGNQSRPAQVTDVTHLRWTIAVIPAGGQGFIKFRGIVR